jgi:hypothetical protein
VSNLCRLLAGLNGERMLHDDVIGDRVAADEVLLDDSLDCRRIAFAVPRALGVHDGDRSALADAQAVGLRPEDTALFRQTQLQQAALEVIPGGKPPLLIATLRLGLVTTKEDMTPGDSDADAGRDFFL